MTLTHRLRLPFSNTVHIGTITVSHLLIYFIFVVILDDVDGLPGKQHCRIFGVVPDDIFVVAQIDPTCLVRRVEVRASATAHVRVIILTSG